MNLVQIYGQHLPRRVPAPTQVALTYRMIQPRLGLLIYNQQGRQAYWDLQHRRLPKETEHERTRTFMGLVRLAHQMGIRGNVNIKSGLKDLMQMLGYADLKRIDRDFPLQGNPDRHRLVTYLQGL